MREKSRPDRSPTFRRTLKTTRLSTWRSISCVELRSIRHFRRTPNHQCRTNRNRGLSGLRGGSGRPDRFWRSHAYRDRLCPKRRVLDSRNDSRGSCALVDDLNAPLGQDKQKRLPRLPATAPQMLAGVLGLSGIVVVAWAAFVSDPLGGEPGAVVATKLAQ